MLEPQEIQHQPKFGYQPTAVWAEDKIAATIAYGDSTPVGMTLVLLRICCWW
jgi:hypothetical protein